MEQHDDSPEGIDLLQVCQAAEGLAELHGWSWNRALAEAVIAARCEHEEFVRECLAGEAWDRGFAAGREHAGQEHGDRCNCAEGPYMHG